LPSSEQVIRACDGREHLRYHETMKKTFRNLVLRSETLRTLANMDLARAFGGLDSGTEPCPALLDTGLKACPTGVAVVATRVR
jgi:hypothetical protein